MKNSSKNCLGVILPVDIYFDYIPWKGSELAYESANIANVVVKTFSLIFLVLDENMLHQCKHNFHILKE